VQPHCKIIDSDTKNGCLNEDPLFKTMHRIQGPIVEENSLDSQTTKDASDFQAKLTNTNSVSEINKERLQAYKKKIMKEMTFADQLDMRDPQCVTEFANDIFSNLRRQEEGF